MTPLLLKKLLPIFAVLMLLLFGLSMRDFSSLDADILAEVTVEGNAAGFVTLLPASTSNGIYFVNKPSSDSDYELRIDNVAKGVNPNACTVIDDVFIISNIGTQILRISADKIGDNVTAVDFSDNCCQGDLDLYDGETGHALEPLIVQPGQSVYISFVIHSEKLGNSDNILQSIILTVELLYSAV